VLNDADGVLIEVEGARRAVADFSNMLRTDAPPLSQILSVVEQPISVIGNEVEGFTIRHSNQRGSNLALLPPDSHVCDACLAEMHDPLDRRYRYPFINCTNCGPRFSLIDAIPYDRAQTTMRLFSMCLECKAEYDDPANRRYHAQPNACPVCGPQVELFGTTGKLADSAEAVAQTLDALQEGQIVAVKSVGGFHLVVDASNTYAVSRLRERKKRKSKPFALMAASVNTIRRWAECNPIEEQWLEASGRPIVLLRKREDNGLPENIAPRNPNLGMMLPSAPLHYLLLSRLELPVLVMTSGNVSGYPIEYRNEGALQRLFEVCDLILLNNRDISVRIDDSVIRCSTHPELIKPSISFLRRARGFAPYTVEINENTAPIIGYGAELKTTVALGDRSRIHVSQHIGDLGNDETFQSHQEIARHLAGLYGLTPGGAACDLHPAFRAGRFAAATYPMVERVQHHHAHMAACMADNRLDGPAIGVIFDGAGYGPDGTIWGGEFLVGDLIEAQRAAHLRSISLLGGDKAVHEPIRTAVALVMEAFEGNRGILPTIPALASLGHQERHVYASMWSRSINVTRASSMGRLFDGVAALAGVCDRAEYEAQGPIEFEGLLGRDLTMCKGYSFDITQADSGLELDYRPIVREVITEVSIGIGPEMISRRFHSTIVYALAAVCVRLREQCSLNAVVLSGGVFLNEFLLINSQVELQRLGFNVYVHRNVPTNDGGISVGQVIVASARMAAKHRLRKKKPGLRRHNEQ